MKNKRRSGEHKHNIIAGKIAAVVAACSFVFLTGCGSSDKPVKIVFTTGFAKDEVFRIEDTVCTLKEAKAYLLNTREGYEASFGEGIWNCEAGNETVEDRLKDSVLAKIAQIKTMDILAAEKGIVLDDKENQKAEEAAAEYYETLSEADIAAMDGITKEDIACIYKDQALADKLYNDIIKDINPEISDDEARTITIEQILIKTYSLDANGNKVDFGESDKAAAKAKADGIYRKIKDEGASFEELMLEYNEADKTELSFGKGGEQPDYEGVAFNLGGDEVSSVFATSEGYAIIKCISKFNLEETEANKAKIVQQRKREVFGEEYDSFVAKLNKQLNEKLWSSVTIGNNPEVTAKGMMDVYQKHFPKK
ncbi:MAG: peptidylprolyl isomerase [Butyrivibrio sp.]|nr:peptidylprolyl isomerase [Butyrivibrio sp.]